MRYAGSVRSLLLALLLAGCSSESAAPTDLAAPPACMFVLSGDWPGMMSCQARFCRGPAGDALSIYGFLTSGPEVNFALAGPFTPGRSYTAADLTFSGGFRANHFRPVYVAGNQIAGSTVTLTIDDIEPNNNLGCASGNGTAHGSAHVGLVEDPGDGGTTGTGHVTLDATF